MTKLKVGIFYLNSTKFLLFSCESFHRVIPGLQNADWELLECCSHCFSP